MTTNFKNRTEGTVVPARSKENIAANAAILREFLKLSDRSYFPVMEVYEVLHYLYQDASFEVRTMAEMGGDHGRTYPDRHLIYIREDIYERAHAGNARDRFTMCHELGHLMMHQGVALSRIDPINPPKIYRNSEWQADTFASYLLMPKNQLCNYYAVTQIAGDFGVTLEAAFARRSDWKSA
jgi:hypothetical protein